MTQTQSLIQTLKNFLKTKGFTYAAVAKRMNLSESALKRAFSEEAFSLKKVEEICEILKVSFADLVKSTSQKKPPEELLTIAQEKVLASDDELFVVLYLILGRLNRDQILKHYRFSVKKVDRLVKKLVKLGLASEKGNKITSPISQSFEWHRNGPLFFKHEGKFIQEFFKNPFLGKNEKHWYWSGNLSLQSLKKIQHRLDQVLLEIQELGAIDAALFSKKELVNITTIFGMKPWVFSLLKKYKKPV